MRDVLAGICVIGCVIIVVVSLVSVAENEKQRRMLTFPPKIDFTSLHIDGGARTNGSDGL